MSEQYGNAAQCQLNSALSGTSVTIPVNFTTGFPQSGAGQFRVLISLSGGGSEEIVLISQTSGSAFNAGTRAAEPYSGNAAALAHVSGEYVTQIITASGLANCPRSMTATGDLEYLNVVGNPARLPIGSVWQVLTASGGLPVWTQISSGGLGSGQVGYNHLASGTIISGASFQNYLINGGMWFAQCVLSGPLFNNPFLSGGQSGGDAYAADQFKAACSSGSLLQYQRWDRRYSGWASGADSRYYGAWQVGGGSGAFCVYQPLESADSEEMANKNVQLQVRAKAPASGFVLRLGLLQTTSGCSGDVIPNSLVSGWSLTSGTDPTWGSGVQLLAPAVNCSVSDAWQVFTVPALHASGGVNLIAAAWVNSFVASGTTLHATEWGLYND